MTYDRQAKLLCGLNRVVRTAVVNKNDLIDATWRNITNRFFQRRSRVIAGITAMILGLLVVGSEVSDISHLVVPNSLGSQSVLFT